MSRNLDPLDAIDSIFTRLNALAVRSDDVEARLERLESARIAAQEAPESAATASGVPVEPGNAPERILLVERPLGDGITVTNESEVAAALRMYRKVRQAEDMGEVMVRVTDDDWYATAAGFLAWLKEGEA